jgi:phospholipase C
LGGRGTLLTNNPNRDASGHQLNPRRSDPTNANDVLLCDQDHNLQRRAEGVQRRADG